MKAFWRASTLYALALATPLFLLPVPAEAEENQPPSKFEKLRIKDGTEYLDCQVVRVEPDALVIRHQAGIARVSFFDLSREIREAYQFDPFAAIAYYQAESERQRGIRWQTFWDKQRHEAKLAGEKEIKQLIEKAVAEWIPVEARVVQTVEDGFLARCKRVTFEKTQKRSKLGFLVDGPPKRKLVDFGGGGLILLRPLTGSGGTLPRRNSTWKGFVYPVADGKQSYRDRGEQLSAPVHRAVKRP